MVLTEYNEKAVMDASRKEGRTLMVYELVKDGDLSSEKGAKRLSVTVDDLKKRMSLCGYTFPASDGGG